MVEINANENRIRENLEKLDDELESMYAQEEAKLERGEAVSLDRISEKRAQVETERGKFRNVVERRIGTEEYNKILKAMDDPKMIEKF